MLVKVLTRKIPNKPNPLLNGIYNGTRDSKNSFFSEVSEKEIISIISTFKTSKGSGPDSIPNFFIKIVVSVMARPLVFLFTSSLFQGAFPDNWKHARVSPLFKDGSTEEQWRNVISWTGYSILSFQKFFGCGWVWLLEPEHKYDKAGCLVNILY